MDSRGLDRRVYCSLCLQGHILITLFSRSCLQSFCINLHDYFSDDSVCFSEGSQEYGFGSCFVKIKRKLGSDMEMIIPIFVKRHFSIPVAIFTLN